MDKIQVQEIVLQLLAAEKRRRFNRKLILIAFAGTFTPALIFAASIGLPNKFSDGDTLSAAKLSENFDGLLAKVNELDTRTTALEAKNDYAVFNQIQSANVGDGGCTAGTWNSRGVNTTQALQGTSITRIGNQFTLNPGTYMLIASAPAYQVDRHKIKLRNITDSTDDLVGTSEHSATGNATNNRSFLHGAITVTTAKTFEIQHRCQVTSALLGNGVESNFGINEVYTVVYLHRIK